MNRTIMKIMQINTYLSGLFWIAIVTAAFVSCNKDDNAPNEEDFFPASDAGHYKFSISAGYTEENNKEITTRTTLDINAGVYYWDTGDSVGLFITDPALGYPVSGLTDNIRLDNRNDSTQVAHTIFTGSLTSSHFNALTQHNTYDYYSYFPYHASIGTFPVLQFQFQTTSTITVSPNTFEPVGIDIPMVAVLKNQPPVFFLDGSGNEHFQMLHLDYDHVMSYAAIEMDCNLNSQTINTIRITNLTSTSTQLWGTTYSYNMLTGTGNYSGGSNILNVSIQGGLTVGGGDVLYIPMPVVNMSGHTLRFEFNPGTASSNAYSTKDILGANFQRGKIHRLRIAPAATYTTSTSFTTTVSGYYYIEAWGGNGGSGRGGREGGVSQKIAGLYQLAAGTTVNVYVGTAGASTSDTGGGTQPPGGINGSSFSNGGNGGNGGTGGGGPGGKGGAGGAGTLIFMNGTSFPSNLRLVSGGAGGGGGSASASFGSYTPGIGGNAGAANSLGTNGGNAGGNEGGYGGLGNGNGNDGGGGGAAGGNADGYGNGGIGGVGQNGSGLYSSGAGGGGAGGGYTTGGGGAEGGGRSVGLNVAGGGGGGAGGASYLTGTTSNPGFSLPNNSRPSVNGHVVITFYR